MVGQACRHTQLLRGSNIVVKSAQKALTEARRPLNLRSTIMAENVSWAMVRAWSAVVAVSLLVACSAPPTGSPLRVEEEVRVRAQQRWDALVAGDVEKAYGFLSPGARQARSLGTYSAVIRKGFWSKAVVERVDCPSPSVCKATVSVEYLFRGSRVASPVSEDWVLADGQWWAAAG